MISDGTAAALCKVFEIERCVGEAREEMKLRGTKVKKRRVVEALGKRISTATPIQHGRASRWRI